MWIESWYGSATTITLHGILQTTEPAWPKIGEKHLEALQAIRVNDVETTLSITLDPYEPGSRQDLEMLRNRLLADVKMLTYLADGPRLVADQTEHRLSARFSQSAQHRFTTHAPQCDDLRWVVQGLTCTSPYLYDVAVTNPADCPLAVARAYHQAWQRREYEGAWRLLSDELTIDVPINSYDTKAAFAEAAQRTREMAASVTDIAEFGDEREAVLIYDMALPIGDLRIAEHFAVDGGQITRIAHIHDTASLRAAGVG